MSQDESTASETPATASPSHVDRWVAGALVIVVVLLVVWVAGGSPDDDLGPRDEPVTEVEALGELAYPDIYIPEVELEELWRRERASLQSELSPMDTALLASYATMSFVTGMVDADLFEGDIDTVISDFDGVLHEWLRLHGPERYRALSWVAYDRFRGALLALLEAVAQDERPLSVWMSDPIDPLVRAMVESGGDFIALALRTGIVTEDGELRVPPTILAAVFRARWFAYAGRTYPIEALMPGRELRLFHEWRIVAADGIELEARLRHIDTYSQQFGDMYGLPREFLRAVALESAGRSGASQAELRALSERDPRFERFLYESAP